jgi:hypothetical protein
MREELTGETAAPLYEMLAILEHREKAAVAQPREAGGVPLYRGRIAPPQCAG